MILLVIGLTAFACFHSRYLSRAEYPLRALRPGLLWRNTVVWPNEQLRGAKRVGIGIYQSSGRRLKADGGERDGNDTRVLIDLPR